MHKHQYVRKGLNYIEEREGCVDMAAGRLEWVGREEREREVDTCRHRFSHHMSRGASRR